MTEGVSAGAETARDGAARAEPAAAADGRRRWPHAELAAELITLPSGLLAMVCQAIVKLKVRLGAPCACMRAFVNEFVRASCVDHQGGPMRTPTRAQCMPE
jgi:hypothetical protein